MNFNEQDILINLKAACVIMKAHAAIDHVKIEVEQSIFLITQPDQCTQLSISS